MLLQLYITASLIYTAFCCPNECSCYRTSVYCERRGINNTDFLSNVPISTTYLYLDDNGIITIGKNTFNGLVNLTTLYLSGNKITTIEDNFFKNFTNLQQLYLNRNGISTIGENTFNGLVKLQTLSLSGNKITAIEENVFKNFTNLQSLYLNGNGISTIRENTFNGLGNLKTLYLNGNGISTIRENTFNGLVDLRHLHLQGNNIRVIGEGAFNGLKSILHIDLDDNGISTIGENAFNGLGSLLFLDFGRGINCSCQVLHVAYRLMEKRVHVSYECSFPTLTVTNIPSQYTEVRNTCSKSEWSSWSTPTQCSGDGNGFIKYTRKCIKLFSAPPCTGLDRKAYLCKNLSYAPTSEIEGHVRIEVLIQNGTTLSSRQFQSMSDYKGNYNELKSLTKETLLWLFVEASIKVENITINSLDANNSALILSYTAKIGQPHTNVQWANPVTETANFTFKNEDDTVLIFILSPNESSVKDVDECQHNKHACDKNADCFKFTNTIAYACRCKKGYQGDGFSCEKKGCCGNISSIRNMEHISLPISSTATLDWLVTLENDQLNSLKLYKGNITENNFIASGNLQNTHTNTNQSLANRINTVCQLIEETHHRYICSLQISKIVSEDQANYTLVGHFQGVAEPVQKSIRLTVLPNYRNERVEAEPSTQSYNEGFQTAVIVLAVILALIVILTILVFAALVKIGKIHLGRKSDANNSKYKNDGEAAVHYKVPKTESVDISDVKSSPKEGENVFENYASLQGVTPNDCYTDLKLYQKGRESEAIIYKNPKST